MIQDLATEESLLAWFCFCGQHIGFGVDMIQYTRYTVYVAILIVVFAAGRYSVPISVKTEKKDVVVDNKTDNKTEDNDIHKHTVTTIVDVTAPDGTKTHTVKKDTDYDNDKKTTEASTDSRRESITETKEVTRAGSRLTIQALAGAKIGSFSSSMVELDYGAMVSRDLLGPVNIGVFGFKSGLAGVSVGLSF